MQYLVENGSVVLDRHIFQNHHCIFAILQPSVHGKSLTFHMNNIEIGLVRGLVKNGQMIVDIFNIYKCIFTIFQITLLPFFVYFWWKLNYRK